VTSSVSEFCNSSLQNLLINEIKKRSSLKCDVYTFPEQFAYPFLYKEIKLIFKEEIGTAILKKIENSFSVHFNTKFTKDMNFSWNDNYLYPTLARFNCPYVATEALKIELDENEAT
jgi:hypothetical protein